MLQTYQFWSSTKEVSRFNWRVPSDVQARLEQVQAAFPTHGIYAAQLGRATSGLVEQLPTTTTVGANLANGWPGSGP